MLLGPDLDSRAYRLPRLAGCNTYEIEGNPAIAAHKARRLAGLPTLWVAEGLLPYLTQSAENQFLAAVGRLSPAGSCMLVDAWGGSSDADRFELDALKAVSLPPPPTAAADAPPAPPLRAYFRALAHWRSVALLLRDDDGEYAGTKWDPVAFRWFKLGGCFCCAKKG
ncbi:hypothetical protein DFJ73DRAFT_769771 [Zopfochytrium polystomum]|nr:hypothetical protein DFJ73DRAFT_769771 [Zopfochytrium polystomum]